LKDPLEPIGLQYALDLKHHFADLGEGLPLITFDSDGNIQEFTEDEVKAKIVERLDALKSLNIEAFTAKYKEWGGTFPALANAFSGDDSPEEQFESDFKDTLKASLTKLRQTYPKTRTKKKWSSCLPW